MVSSLGNPISFVRNSQEKPLPALPPSTKDSIISLHFSPKEFHENLLRASGGFLGKTSILLLAKDHSELLTGYVPV